ncbi:hypothetical protein TNCV_2729321 [Trichonephila clavipes]|nr:hypothetical protein TNCV_2729321 [Trichonephila clavipes]
MVRQNGASEEMRRSTGFANSVPTTPAESGLPYWSASSTQSLRRTSRITKCSETDEEAAQGAQFTQKKHQKEKNAVQKYQCGAIEKVPQDQQAVS